MEVFRKFIEFVLVHQDKLTSDEKIDDQSVAQKFIELPIADREG